MNPLRQTGREIDRGGVSRFFLFAGILLALCSVVLSWLLIGQGVENSGLLTMILWMLIVVIAVVTLLLSGRSAFDVNPGLIATGSLLVIVLGTVTAFISGDKFDTVRAALLFLIMAVLLYRRRAATAASQNLRGLDE